MKTPPKTRKPAAGNGELNREKQALQGLEIQAYTGSESLATLSVYDGRDLLATLTIYGSTVYVTDSDGRLRGPFGSRAAALQYVVATMAPA